jgi:mono/diheme cytochrome c family protein
MARRSRLARAALAAAAASAVAALGFQWWRSHNVGPVTRGLEVAGDSGCFACHAGAGRLAFEPDSEAVGSVPSFEGDDVRAYARNAAEIRAWILDGAPERVRRELQGMAPEKRPLLRMPAWRGVLSPSEVNALVAYVEAVAGFDAPLRGTARDGYAAAERLGCFGCHGPGGRVDTPNPGAFKGYIPAWSGADFPELVRDAGELREWVREGAPVRLRKNPIALFFMSRAALGMPAYGERVAPVELDAIVAYVGWLRRQRGERLPGAGGGP